MKLLLFQTKFFALLLALSAFLFSPTFVLAQKKFSKTYLTSRNIRLQLINRSGTITVSGWNRNEIRVTALMEAPAAKFVPESNNDSLTINVVRDNYGRSDVGSVNFEVKVPLGSTVDIETRMGNLTVRDVSGEMVRANVTSEGDITLSNIKASSVMAANVIGDIFFDGEFQTGGTYRFATTRGNINMHVPFSSSFRMVATAPSTRNISLGSFANSGLNFISQGQRVIGNVGGGNASLTVSSQRGSISFVK
jgi:hypothetical protein